MVPLLTPAHLSADATQPEDQDAPFDQPAQSASSVGAVQQEFLQFPL